jgi:hypothetical protein
MTVKSIPDGSVEIQSGLWAAVNSFTVSRAIYSFYDIYSAEGYCFWDIQQPENYDEEGNLLPMEQRVYAQYSRTSYTSIEELNMNYVSVPAQEGYEIVSAISDCEVI